MSWDSFNGGGQPDTSGFVDEQPVADGFGEAKAGGDFGGDSGGDHGAGNEGGNDGGCFNCGEQGHMKSDCPNPRVLRENTGACFNCGEVGHNKSDCPNPTVPREFTGECRLCGTAGHRASDCPEAGPRMCKNCGQEGHAILECKNPRLIDRNHILEVMPELGWEELKAAAAGGDLDDIKEAISKYVKAVPDTTYVQLESAFRAQELAVHVIALERELALTYTNMDLQGNLDKKYTVTYRLSDKPKRPKEKEGWPENPEENLERLKDAGEPVDRGIPKCGNCEQLGHTSRSCPEEKQEPTDRTTVKCFNCDEVGHRVRDCPTPRPDKFACRNCKQSGHTSKECSEPRSAEGVECKKCNETGHFARDCPTGGGGDNACRNCGQEGHRSKECTEPRNPATMTCRNCDETGHISKECPKPRDYSRVKCSNCQQMGHTKVRCKEPLVEEDAAADMGNGDVTVHDAVESAPAGEATDGW